MLKTHTREEVYIDFKDHLSDCGISVCEWHNGEGIDITIDTKGVMQAYSFTYGQFEAINALIQCMRSGIDLNEKE